ncbi:glycoside hydrolase family 2 TIM barrel-domain containing protein [Oleiharenicola sp. Vm1]|uniref:glycoside hydrolase family 2 TIM barrel-domain containing protein n=1 Tax=Oleiharenicola sp. Vm1 TaxID=3398393 RepID=UPI0039F4BA5F
MPAGRQANVAHALVVKAPKLWSLRERHRYVAETRVLRDGKVIDGVRTPFGIRSIAISPERGFLLNGEHVVLNGVCNHHDLGALGAAINVRALERQLEILQAMGCNAIRTSHNPPAPELLELCDRLGFVVMVEAFDAWRLGKKRDDYSRVFDDWHEKDLRAMVRRDRNHPCVVQWSIGNEVRELFEADGWKLAAHLAAIVREEDRTRPVVAGMHNVNAPYMGFQGVLDIVGYNYKPGDYAKLRARYPQLVIEGSETASTISSRGEYFFPVADDKALGRSDFQVSSYDLYTPRWALPPDVEWKGLDENPPVLGEFVWTGFDYLGEPTPFNADATNLLNFADPAARERAAKELAELGKIRVPSRSSYFGIIDLAGFPKDRFYLYQSRWRPDLRMAHILPHWNWPERVGQVTPVQVYSSGDEAELFLNGQSLGRKRRGPFEYRFRWDDVRYQPGELKVVTYKHGQPWADAVVRTTGPAAAVRLKADRTALRADGQDLVFVTAEVVDAQGLVVPRAKSLLKFSVEGPADLVATDNGDATSHVSFQSPERAAFNGLALLVVRPRAGGGGAIRIRAAAEGLAPAEIEVTAQ